MKRILCFMLLFTGIGILVTTGCSNAPTTAAATATPVPPNGTATVQANQTATAQPTATTEANQTATAVNTATAAPTAAFQATATAVPTMELQGYGWENNNLDYWGNNTNPAGETMAVTNIALFAATPPPNTSTYGLGILWPAVAITGSNNYCKVETDGAWGNPALGGSATGVNWTTLGITSVSMQYWVSSNFGAYNFRAYPYLKAGTGPNVYGGLYYAADGCNASYAGGCNVVPVNDWITVTYTPSSPPTGSQLSTWAVDSAEVNAVGVEMNLGANASFAGGLVVIDNVVFH